MIAEIIVKASVNLSSFINFNALAYHKSQCKNTVEKEREYLRQYESLLWKFDRSSDSFTNSVTTNLQIFQRKRISLFTLTVHKNK